MATFNIKIDSITIKRGKENTVQPAIFLQVLLPESNWTEQIKFFETQFNTPLIAELSKSQLDAFEELPSQENLEK